MEEVTISKEHYYTLIALIMGALAKEGRELDAGLFLANEFLDNSKGMGDFMKWFEDNHKEGEQ